MIKRKRRPVRTSVLHAGLTAMVITLAATGAAHAAGFALIEQGVKQMGTGYAGTAATAEDASVIGYNPAGIGFLDGTQISGSLFIINTYGTFDGEGRYGFTNAPVPGGDGGNAGGVTPVPALYLSHRLADNAAVGLGIYMPFGTQTNYENGWTGRYQADLSKIFAINFNPVFAFKPTKNLSLGFGVVIQYFEAKLTNDIDAGTLASGAAYEQQAQLSQVNPSIPAPTQAQLAGALSDTQGQYDVHSDLSGHDVTYGFNAGILWEPTSSTRIGLAYHSATTPNIDGTVERTGYNQAGVTNGLMPYFGPDLSPAVAQGVGAQLASTGGNTEAKLPDRIDLGIRQAVTPNLALLAGVQWTHWNRLDKLVIRYDDNRTNTIIPENYDNAYRFAGGAEYRINPTWTVRGGLAYDQSPVDGESRDARVPDNDRLTLAIGATVRATEKLTLDFGYQHLFVHKGSINETAVDGSGNTLKGNFDISADVFALQANYAF